LHCIYSLTIIFSFYDKDRSENRHVSRYNILFFLSTEHVVIVIDEN